MSPLYLTVAVARESDRSAEPFVFLAVNRYRNTVACCGLGAAGQRFAVNAVALLLSLVVVAGLNLIFILGIGRQVLIRVAEGVVASS